MNVGDYVRTKDGVIGKIIDDNLAQEETRYEIDYNNKLYYSRQIAKSSPNIIDLIEVGDYINDYYVEDIIDVYDDEDTYRKIMLASGCNYFQPNITEKEQIKSIVTKEQFESMEYKVGE